jgi:hypothetical protein
MIPGIVQSQLLGAAEEPVFDGSIYAEYLVNKPSVGDGWIPEDTHYTDDGFTTVAEVDDPIGGLSGTGGVHDATQTNSSLRPYLRESGGKKYFDLQTINYAWSVPGSGSPIGSFKYLHNDTGDAYVIIACSVRDDSSNPNTTSYILSTFGAGSSATGALIRYDDRASLSRDDRVGYVAGRSSSGIYAADQTSANDKLMSQTDAVIELIKDGAQYEMFVNGESVFSGTLSSPSSSAEQYDLHIGTLAGLAGYSIQGKLYGLFVAGTLPDSGERDTFQSDMAARCLTPPTMS